MIETVIMGKNSKRGEAIECADYARIPRTNVIECDLELPMAT